MFIFRQIISKTRPIFNYINKFDGIRNPILLMRTFSVINEEVVFQSELRAPRTSLMNPREHTLNHVGMWYCIDPDIVNKLFFHFGLNNKYGELTRVIGETCLMIREPAITIKDYIMKSNLNQIPNKYLLYGRKGSGKSTTLLNLIHFLHNEEFIIMHINCPSKLCVKFKEILPSITRQGYYDHTVDASEYLKHFLSQNGTLLQKLQLTTSHDYQWNVRESTAKGSSLLTLIDFGIQRARYASEIIYNLNSELKEYAKQGKCKIALVFDGINTFFHPVSFYVTDDKTVIPPHKFTFFEAFRNLLLPDWHNGCIIGSINIEMSTKDRRKSYLPRYLLRKEGWDTLDPFIPVRVDKYSSKEFHSAIDYYLEMKWLQHPKAGTPEGREELHFMSGQNPGELIKIINVH